MLSMGRSGPLFLQVAGGIVTCFFVASLNFPTDFRLALDSLARFVFSKP
jgi:hypothetical protein